LGGQKKPFRYLNFCEIWTKLCIDIFHQTNVQKRVSFAQEEGETRLAVASP
jgi:hypothetical protein